MWKPDDVVAEHKKRATLVWVAMLLSVVGFVAWQSYTLAEKYKKPSTTFTVKDDVYLFPYMEVCFSESYDGYGQGCDRNLEEGQCLETVNATISHPCWGEPDVQIDSSAQSQNCVTFDLETVDTEELAKKDCFGRARPSIELEMFWIASFDAGEEGPYVSRVAVYLGGADVQDRTWVPYSRIVISEEKRESELVVPETFMTIGKSTRKLLSGSTNISYPILAISTTDYVIPNQSSVYDRFNFAQYSPSGGGDLAVGALFFTLTLGSLSLTELSENDPLNVPEFISSIGGFWEVLAVAWGVFFIAGHSDTTPKQKARNFAKAIRKGVQTGKRPIAKEGPSPPPGMVSDSEGGGEEQPNWDIAGGGPVQATGSSNGGRVLGNEKQL